MTRILQANDFWRDKVATPKNQADQRRDLVLADQFGRRWFMSIEILTGEPTGAITRAGSWLDPLKTPQQFIKVPPTDIAGGQWRVEIDFPNWLQQQEAAEEYWGQMMRRAALAIYKKLDPEDLPHLENDVLVREAVGRKPWPSSLVLRAAQGGDRQYLGLEPLDGEHRKGVGLPVLMTQQAAAAAPAVVEMPAAGHVPEPPDQYQPFVSWAFRYGGAKSIAEAAKQWKDLHTVPA